ncbi:hypothetical protein TWF594_001345 [Orbilia oligospora]|nr:hypothetical protein TWF706_009376 [Orbilia oligospora]KAF3125671.1 hypothetical protein TWF594_001345 [Orbilia oligospora]
MLNPRMFEYPTGSTTAHSYEKASAHAHQYKSDSNISTCGSTKRNTVAKIFQSRSRGLDRTSQADSAWPAYEKACATAVRWTFSTHETLVIKIPCHLNLDSTTVPLHLSLDAYQ